MSAGSLTSMQFEDGMVGCDEKLCRKDEELKQDESSKGNFDI